jgi:dynactin complex subunit
MYDDLYHGHNHKYWLALQRRVDELPGVEKIFEENIRLRGVISTYESMITRLYEFKLKAIVDE